MVREIAEGYVLITERSFVRFAPPELDKVRFEIDRYLREIRGDQPALDDTPALRLRNRRLQRLTGAAAILNAYRLKSRR
jgi:hypothetical protein